MNYYERHIGDYLKDTAHLSLLEHGIYGRLLDLYYTREGPLKDEGLHRLVGARTDDERAAMQVVLEEFFTFSPEMDHWSHVRCDRELGRYQEKQQKARNSANARWSHSERNANALPTQSEGNALQTPGTSNQTPVTKKKEPSGSSSKAPYVAPEWVPADAWQDFVQMRKAIRGVPFTPAAAAGVVRELRKLCDEGFDATDLLQTAVTSSWRTVYRPKQDNRLPFNQPVNKQEAIEERNRSGSSAWAAKMKEQLNAS